MSIAENVASGMDLLDEEYPGWEELIDLDTLDLSSDCGCILGQLYDDKALQAEGATFSPYEYALFALEIAEDEEVELGFFAPGRWTGPDCTLDWTGLRDEWVRQIKARLAVRELVSA